MPLVSFKEVPLWCKIRFRLIKGGPEPVYSLGTCREEEGAAGQEFA